MHKLYLDLQRTLMIYQCSSKRVYIYIFVYTITQIK